MSSRLKVGDRAPQFSLPDQNGNIVSLSSYIGKKHVILYFYPRDFSIGCTRETKAFAESYQRIRELGGEVIGISSDPVDRHNAFAKECNAPFILLSDTNNEVRRAYGVSSTLGLIPGRVTFVIDKEGIIRHIFSSQISPSRHVIEAIEALRKINT